MKSQKRFTKLYNQLCTMYPDAATELKFANDYQLLVSVMLSAQTTDKKVNEITPSLFSKFPSFQQLALAKLDTVEILIKQINYYKTKAKHLVKSAEMICAFHNGKLPHSFEELVKLPGVGRKTANVILSELGVAQRIAVDTHVFRTAKRLDLADGTSPLEVEEELMKLFPPENWRSLHHMLILHGRRICKARTPLCSSCGLNKLCQFKT